MSGLLSFIVYILVALVLTVVPVVGKYFRLLNTLVHEVGHVIVSLLTSGKVYKVQIFSDTSGVAYTGTNNWFSRVLTSLAGYPFASASAFGLIYLMSIDKTIWVFYIIMSLLLVSLVFWVRNIFGLVWICVFGFFTFMIHASGTENMFNIYITLIIAVLLVESVKSSFVILKLSIKSSSNSGDAYNLSQSTFIPAVVWGLFFAVQSVYFLVLGFNYWT